MRKIALILILSLVWVTMQAQVIKHYTVQISNPAPCTTCCNGTVFVQVSNCGGLISCSLTVPGSTFAMGGSCMWMNLCNGIYTVAVNVGDTTFCPVTCSIISGYNNATTNIAQNYISQPDSLNIFPNPAAEVLYIKANDQKIRSFALARLTNGTGELVKEEKLIFSDTIAELKTHALPGGIYFLEVIVDGQTPVRRRIMILEK